MKINDFVYGKFEIEEPVLIDLVNSKPVQRLKKIEQSGIPQEYNNFKGYSRYEHSVGVMLLLRKLGANVEEQAAGLLHDISHTAFSHVADLVFGYSDNEDFQDRNHERILMNSEVPKILSTYGFDSKKLANPENFSLLERPAPDLCADRLDYSLREIHLWANPGIVQDCINHLINYNGKIVFNSKKIAKDFSEAYMRCQNENWAGIVPSIKFYIISKILRYALDNKIIIIDDFYKDDEYLMNILKETNNKEIKSLFAMLKKDINFEVSENDPEINIKKKFRYVNPEYLEDGKIYRLSEVDKDYKEFLDENKKINQRGIKVNILKS